MFKFKFDKKTKEQKDMEKQGKKLEKEYTCNAYSNNYRNNSIFNTLENI